MPIARTLSAHAHDTTTERHSPIGHTPDTQPPPPGSFRAAAFSLRGGRFHRPFIPGVQLQRKVGSAAGVAAGVKEPGHRRGPGATDFLL